MRRHFHRCANLRVISVPAQELHGARRGGGVILEELCEAKQLTPCVGLVECDVLTTGQKQDLLAERATRIRQEEGRPTELSGVSRERAREIEALGEEFARERDALVEENLRREAEITASEDRELVARKGEAGELGQAGLALELAPAWSELRIERLDQLDRALGAMQDRTYGTCALCGGEIAIERLRLYPETRVCAPCAREAPAARRLSAGREARDPLG
jgi:RNA polymerase-binding transcription factor DksA